MPTVVWSASLSSTVRWLALAREAEWLLAREAAALSLFNAAGVLQGRTHFDGLSSAALADDGSALAAGAADGVVRLLGVDLQPRWDRTLPAPVVAVALDPFGNYLAATDAKRGLHLFDRAGTLVGRLECPRPAVRLAFVPAKPLLIAAADLGWIGAADLTTGTWTWNDRPVSSIGSLSASGYGEPIAAACFSEGIRRYGPGGEPRPAVALPRPCGLVAMSFVGDRGVAAGGGRDLYAFDVAGRVALSHPLDHTPTALALSALGDRVAIGTSDGTLTLLDLG